MAKQYHLHTELSCTHVEDNVTKFCTFRTGEVTMLGFGESGVDKTQRYEQSTHLTTPNRS